MWIGEGKVFLACCLLLGVTTECTPACDMDPTGISGPRNTQDVERYRIEIAGNPEAYVPGEQYTVFLKSARRTDEDNRFVRFVLAVENKQSDKAKRDSISVGSIQLFGDSLTKLNEDCPNSVFETDTQPKTDIQVLWIAPAAGNGCIIFKATIVESSGAWFSQEGPLTKVLCEVGEDSDNIQPTILQQCCACDEAKYESEHIRTIIKARGISYPNITGKTFAVFRVDNRHHLMSIVSMIDPSPDWIVGVSSLELCLRNCSWVESNVINLYPWDAGTDDGVTYISPNQPASPRQPIRRIKPNSLNDTRSPFFNPPSNELKPFARLYLSRQRLYEKECDPSINKDSESEKINCETEAWSDWSPCSATCGRGVKYKQRRYKNEDSKYLCHEKLTERASCEAVQRYCPHKIHREEAEDPMCELGPWGTWSSCSVTCGKGTKTRDRKYKSRYAAKACGLRRKNPPILQQNIECVGDEVCDEFDQISPGIGCKRKPWSQWSPCSASCGNGIKVRYRLSLDPAEKEFLTKWPLLDSYLTGYDESEEFSEEDPCINIRMKETVECVERPCVEDAVPNNPSICKLSKDVGQCKNNIDRWYFNNVRAECEIFSYSGCRGNLNNFKTLEQCQTLCAGSQREMGEFTTNYTTKRKEFGVGISGVLSHNIQNDGMHVSANLTSYGHVHIGTRNDQKYGDCEVSRWSEWTPCNITEICGYGYMFKYRRIIVETENGGRPCPKKLWKKRKCYMPCNKNLTYLSADNFNYNHIKIDCVLSEWSSWSECDSSCNSPKYQTRQRKILVQPSSRGQSCPPRIEQRLCPCHL